MRYLRLFFLMIFSLSAFSQYQFVQGGIVRGDTSKKEMALVFTGHEFADGGLYIQKYLKSTETPASFFFTGDFLRKYSTLAKDLSEEGHFVGAHSDKHLLYCSWEKRDSILVSKKQLLDDLKKNNEELEKLGIKKSKWFMPPYEWYNTEISNWLKEEGVQIVNFTSGTLSTADYTTLAMKNYRDTETIMKSIYKYEEEKGFNGFILLVHIGTEPERIDKLYYRLPELVAYLKRKGYSFKRIDDILE